MMGPMAITCNTISTGDFGGPNAKQISGSKDKINWLMDRKQRVMVNSKVL